MAGDFNGGSSDKENQSQNAGNYNQFRVQISQQDKEFIKLNIFNCMDMYSQQNKKIR